MHMNKQAEFAVFSWNSQSSRSSGSSGRSGSSRSSRISRSSWLEAFRKVSGKFSGGEDGVGRAGLGWAELGGGGEGGINYIQEGFWKVFAREVLFMDFCFLESLFAVAIVS